MRTDVHRVLLRFFSASVLDRSASLSDTFISTGYTDSELVFCNLFAAGPDQFADIMGRYLSITDVSVSAHMFSDMRQY